MIGASDYLKLRINLFYVNNLWVHNRWTNKELKPSNKIKFKWKVSLHQEYLISYISYFVFLREILSTSRHHLQLGYDMSTINRKYTIERNMCFTVFIDNVICKFLISFAFPLFPTLRWDFNTSFFLSPHWKAYFCPSPWFWENRKRFSHNLTKRYSRVKIINRN